MKILSTERRVAGFFHFDRNCSRREAYDGCDLVKTLSWKSVLLVVPPRNVRSTEGSGFGPCGETKRAAGRYLGSIMPRPKGFIQEHHEAKGTRVIRHIVTLSQWTGLPRFAARPTSPNARTTTGPACSRRSSAYQASLRRSQAVVLAAIPEVFSGYMMKEALLDTARETALSVTQEIGHAVPPGAPTAAVQENSARVPVNPGRPGRGNDGSSS